MSLVRATASTEWADWRQTASEHGMGSPPSPTGPGREDDQRLCWSSAWWSPPPESNRRPHPYHGTTRNRCADRRFPRSRPTVGAKVIGSLSAKLCALLARCEGSVTSR